MTAYIRPSGRCPGCVAWFVTLVEEKVTHGHARNLSVYAFCPRRGRRAISFDVALTSLRMDRRQFRERRTSPPRREFRGVEAKNNVPRGSRHNKMQHGSDCVPPNFWIRRNKRFPFRDFWTKKSPPRKIPSIFPNAIVFNISTVYTYPNVYTCSSGR